MQRSHCSRARRTLGSPRELRNFADHFQLSISCMLEIEASHRSLEEFFGREFAPCRILVARASGSMDVAFAEPSQRLSQRMQVPQQEALYKASSTALCKSDRLIWSLRPQRKGQLVVIRYCSFGRWPSARRLPQIPPFWRMVEVVGSRQRTSAECKACSVQA